MDSLNEPKLLKFRETRLNWGALPKANIPGFIRGAGQRVIASNCYGRIVMVPRGQGTPPHRIDGELVTFMLEGEVDFEFPKDRPGEHFVLNKYDILFVPANTLFQNTNVGLQDALWFVTVAKSPNGDWPITSSFEEGKTTDDRDNPSIR